MQAKFTQSFLAALSLLGVLTLPAAASAHDDEDYYDNQAEVRREYHQPSYADREDLYLQRLPRDRDYYGRSYDTDRDDYSRDRWYGGQRRYGRYYQGKSCHLRQWSYGNDR